MSLFGVFINPPKLMNVPLCSLMLHGGQVNFLSFGLGGKTASLGLENESSSSTGTETSISTRQDFLVFVGQVTRDSSMGNPSHSITHLLSVFLLRWVFCQLNRVHLANSCCFLPASSHAWPLWFPTCSVGRVLCSSLLQTSRGLCLQFLLSRPQWR